jgi:hypothetical protein
LGYRFAAALRLDGGRGTDDPLEVRHLHIEAVPLEAIRNPHELPRDRRPRATAFASVSTAAAPCFRAFGERTSMFPSCAERAVELAGNGAAGLG